jgi:hypothetical protein
VAAGGDISRVVTSLQPNLGIEIREERLSREGILSIDTRLVNNTPYAVVVEFPTITLSADPPRTPLTKRTVLKLDADYELLEDKVVTGYLPAGATTFHSVVLRLKDGAPHQGVSYQLRYGAETDQHVKGIIMKYLAGAVTDLKPSDVDSMTKKTFGWNGRVSAR